MLFLLFPIFSAFSATPYFVSKCETDDKNMVIYALVEAGCDNEIRIFKNEAQGMKLAVHLHQTCSNGGFIGAIQSPERALAHYSTSSMCADGICRKFVLMSTNDPFSYLPVSNDEQFVERFQYRAEMVLEERDPNGQRVFKENVLCTGEVFLDY